MKIAVCYSGFPRLASQVFPHQQKTLFDGHDVDFFVHPWENDSYEEDLQYVKDVLKPKLLLKDKPKKFERNPYTFINPDLNEDKYLDQLLKSGEDKKFFPVPCEENNYAFDKKLEVVKFRYYSSFPFPLLSQYYSIYKANELKKIYEQMNDFKYDCAVRMRSDFVCEPINFEDYNLQAINLPKSPLHRGTDLTVNDHFAFSSSEMMDIYSECFLFIPTYYYIYKVDLIQELLLGKHLRVNNLDIDRIQLQSSLVREGVNTSLET